RRGRHRILVSDWSSDVCSSDLPFQGCKGRRFLPEGMLSSDMERIAAERAIERAGIDRREIGLVLCGSSVPDHLVTSNACLLHERSEERRVGREAEPWSAAEYDD